MKEFSYTIKDESGIHARPAGLLIKKAGEFHSEITVHKGAKTADAKKIFSVMALGAKKGDVLTFAVSGDDEDEAVLQLKSFLESSL